MNGPIEIKALAPSERISARAFNVAAAGLVFFAYLVALQAVDQDGLRRNLISAVVNLMPLLLLGAAVRTGLQRYVIDRSLQRQLAAHIGFALAFTALWYWLLMVLMGLTQGESITRFSVQPFFPNPAIVWQLMQGLTFYALIAAVTYLQAKPSLPAFVVIGADAATAAGKEECPRRYFIRQGEEIYPVDVSQIVSIAGADDYADVTTLSGRHLVRMTLAQFETTLEKDSFIRVHRSQIVNLDRIVRAEPAGSGRMLLHMENGEIIRTSRTGTKLLRDRVI